MILLGLFSSECGNCGSKEHATSECPHGLFSSKCGKCGSTEHATSDCPQGIFSSKCGSCGSTEHATSDCPHGMFSSKCGSCGSVNHSTSDCPHGILSSKCGNCGSTDHATSDCPHGVFSSNLKTISTDKTEYRDSKIPENNTSNSSYDYSSTKTSASDYVNKKEDNSIELPWQWGMAQILGFLGFIRLSNFFYSTAADIYLREGKKYTAGRLMFKAGNYESAFEQLINADEIDEANFLAREHGLENMLLEKLEFKFKRKEAGDLSYHLGLKERAIINYEKAALCIDISTSIDILRDAGEIAEEIGDFDKAIELYKRGGETGTSKYNTDLYSRQIGKYLLEKAEAIEKSLE